jgi:DNA-binding NarL/FixJ family response regulator
MNSAKIILIEDNPEYRRVIKRALDLAPGMELVAKYGTAEQALRDLESSPQLRQADVVLLDLRLPKTSGLEALPWIKHSCPDIKVIVLTQSGDPKDILEAIRQGVAGYLLKSSTVQQIRDGIEAVVNGGSSLDSSVASLILETLQKNLAPRDQPPGLSEREHDVLVLLSEGLVKKEIADRLEISSHTVATHVRHIYEKLGVINAPAAVSVAYRKGLLHVNRPGNGADSPGSGS